MENVSNNIICTVAEFAELTNSEYLATSGFLKFLEKSGMVKRQGSRKSKAGKGKPSLLYSIPKSMVFTVPDNSGNGAILSENSV